MTLLASLFLFFCWFKRGVLEKRSTRCFWFF